MDELTNSAMWGERSQRNIQLLRYSALAVLAAVVIAANLVLFHQIDLQLERSYTAESDSTIWNLTQVDVELLRFEVALQDAAAAPPEARAEVLEQLRLQFDLLYSRVQVIERTRRLADSALVLSPDWQLVVAEDGLLETALPLIDGPDDALVGAAPALATRTKTIIANLRDDVVASSIASIRRTEVQRTELQSSLQLFSAVSLGLMGLMSALIIVIYLQGRARERHRKELAQAVYNLRTTIDSSLEAAVILDHDGRIIGCNRAGARMFDWSGEGRTVRYFADTVRDIRRGADGLAEVASACLDGHSQGRITLNGYRGDGTVFPLEVSLAQARSAAGLPIAIAFVRDISERVEREEALREARNAAQQGEEAKSRFLAMISHEMRTPLNGLLSAVDLLNRDTRLDEKQAWLTRVIENCGKATLDQVNNVLDLTSLQSPGDDSLPQVDFSLSHLAQDVANQFEAEARNRGNTIEVVVTGADTDVVRGRKALVQRVLSNLVSNGVKFTEKGKITIGLDCQPGRSGNSVAVRFSVADTGVGIADADRDRIFRAFETLDSSYSRLQQGSGLGLGLAKLAAEAMGGRITVTSKPGAGSTFSLFLNLPAATPESAAELEAGMDEGSGSSLGVLKLLVAEDNPVNRELITEILRLKGHEVVQAANGVEALELAALTRHDAILMDISMPVMDGLEATRRIRETSMSGSVPIIAVTANSDSLSPETFQSAGITEVLSKPVDFRKLERILAKHVVTRDGASQSRGASPVPETDPAVPRHPPRLRLVETAVEPSKEQPSRTRKGTRSRTAKDSGGPRRVKSASGPTTGSPSARQLLDETVLDDLREALGAGYIAKMAARYIDETEQALAELGSHEAAGDLSAAAQVAHKNAGAAAALGLKAMHRLLVNYEVEAKSGDCAAIAQTKRRFEAVKRETFDLLKERGLTA